MNEILNGLDGVVCQMNDILVFGHDAEQHDNRLIEVLKRIEAAGATLNKEKCSFGQEKLRFLGHAIDKNGITSDPDKVSAITEMKAPTHVCELRRFMSMINKLGKFTPYLAELTKPLRELLSNKRTWIWGPDQETAFLEIKKSFPN